MAKKSVPEASLVFKNIGTWVNKHRNVKQKIDGLYDIWNPTPAEGNKISRLKATVRAFQSLIQKAMHEGKTLRAYGGAWSLSKAAVTGGYMVNTKPLNIRGPMLSTSVSDNYPGNKEGLHFFQCGVSVHEANDYLVKKGRALKTTGASNGQSMAGAVLTGTHGAAFGFGAMQDYVVALHFVVGPNRHVWIERASRPVVSDDFITKLGAEHILDDKIFNAAVVSFGSFGMLSAMVVETEPLYLLRMYRFKHKLDTKLLNAMSTLDFSEIAMPRVGETPYCFQVVLNLNDIENGVFVTAMYKDADEKHDPPAVNEDGYGPGDDLLAFIGQLDDVMPSLIGKALSKLINTFIKTPPLGTQGDKRFYKETGWPGEIFRSIKVRGEGTSMEVGIPLARAADAVKVLQQTAAAKGPIGGVVGIRYVKSSKATLAFTRHSPVTCTIEFQGLNNDRTLAIFDDVWSRLDKANIPYTFHWGQVHNLTPDRTQKAYTKARVQAWVAARHALLEPAVREVFNNRMLSKCSLDG